MSWTAVLVAILLGLVVVLMKFLICNCLVRRRLREEGREGNPIISPRRQAFWIDYERMREEPPNFDEALRCSVPVSYIEVEEPPPSYQDFINSSYEEDYQEYSHSVNPSDSLTLDNLTNTSSAV